MSAPRDERTAADAAPEDVRNDLPSLSIRRPVLVLVLNLLIAIADCLTANLATGIDANVIQEHLASYSES